MNQRKFMVSTRRLAMMLIMALGSSLMAFAASAENSIQAVQQQGDVKGTVTDANGETIIGATVRVLGTQNAAIPISMATSPSRQIPDRLLRYHMWDARLLASRLQASQ